jgi:hypothetical protein
LRVSPGREVLLTEVQAGSASVCSVKWYTRAPFAGVTVKAKAYIAIPLGPTSSWRLLRSPDELDEGFVIVGSLEIGRSGPVALVSEFRGRIPRQVRRALCADCPLRASSSSPPGGSEP